MAEMINPEYKLADDTDYLPQGPGAYGKHDTELKVIKNVDGTNGYSLYDGDILVYQTEIVGNNNTTVSVDKEAKRVEISFDSETVQEGTGIKVTDLGHGVKEISQDEEWLVKFIGESGFVKGLRGENGVIVEDDDEVVNGKVVKLDDEYIIDQGEY